jgi:hypothetical protein
MSEEIFRFSFTADAHREPLVLANENAADFVEEKGKWLADTPTETEIDAMYLAKLAVIEAMVEAIDIHVPEMPGQKLADGFLKGPW